MLQLRRLAGVHQLGSHLFASLSRVLLSTTNKQEVYKDLLDNPEFLNAFPHLKTRFLELSRER